MKPVGLVACCKTKLDRPAQAKDLYTGALFRMSVEWLVGRGRVDEWGILSARHGLLMPGVVTEPYEQTLVGAPRDQVRSWASRTAFQLRDRWPGREFLVIAGKEYAAALEGLPCEHAFAGLPLGRKLQALRRSLDG